MLAEEMVDKSEIPPRRWLLSNQDEDSAGQKPQGGRAGEREPDRAGEAALHSFHFTGLGREPPDPPSTEPGMRITHQGPRVGQNIARDNR